MQLYQFTGYDIANMLVCYTPCLWQCLNHNRYAIYVMLDQISM